MFSRISKRMRITTKQSGHSHETWCRYVVLVARIESVLRAAPLMTMRRPRFSCSSRSPEVSWILWNLGERSSRKIGLRRRHEEVVSRWCGGVGNVRLACDSRHKECGRGAASDGPRSCTVATHSKIPVPGVAGRIDHFTAFPKRRLLIFAGLGNNSMEIVNTFQAKVVQSVKGLTNLKACSTFRARQNICS